MKLVLYSSNGGQEANNSFLKKSRVGTYISFYFNVLLHMLNNMVFVNLYRKKDAPFLLILTQKIIINCRWDLNFIVL